MRFTAVVRNVVAPGRNHFARSAQASSDRLIIASPSNTGIYLPLTSGSFASKFQEFLDFLKSNADLCGRPPELIWREKKYLGISLGRINLSNFPSSMDSATSDVHLAERVLKNTVESIAFKTKNAPARFKLGILVPRDSEKSLFLFPLKSEEDNTSRTLSMISKTVFIHFARAGLLARPQVTPSPSGLRVLGSYNSEKINFEALYAKPEFQNFLRPGYTTSTSSTVFLDLGEVEVSELAMVPVRGSPIHFSWKDVDLSKMSSSSPSESSS